MRSPPSCSFLPPYSPNFELIEQVFAKLKTRLRKAAQRNVESDLDPDRRA
jgi:transposase